MLILLGETRAIHSAESDSILLGIILTLEIAAKTLITLLLWITLKGEQLPLFSVE